MYETRFNQVVPYAASRQEQWLEGHHHVHPFREMYLATTSDSKLREDI